MRLMTEELLTPAAVMLAAIKAGRREIFRLLVGEHYGPLVERPIGRPTVCTASGSDAAHTRVPMSMTCAQSSETSILLGKRIPSEVSPDLVLVAVVRPKARSISGLPRHVNV
jgi:hypothetical protein